MSSIFNVFRKLYTVVRKAKGRYVDGHWQEGAESTFDILASVQPLTAREMSTLPEGRRKNQTFKVYTDTKLNTVQNASQEGSNINPDLIIVPQYAVNPDQERFEVVGAYPYQSGIIDHYKYEIQLTNQGQ